MAEILCILFGLAILILVLVIDEKAREIDIRDKLIKHFVKGGKFEGLTTTQKHAYLDIMEKK